MSYCYSFDEEQFHGEFATKDEAIAEAVADADGDHTVAWIGETRPAREMLGEWWLGEHATERISELLYDEIGEYSENFDPTEEQNRALGKVILDWVEDNIGFHCYGVHKVERVELPLDARPE